MDRKAWHIAVHGPKKESDVTELMLPCIPLILNSFFIPVTVLQVVAHSNGSCYCGFGAYWDEVDLLSVELWNSLFPCF